MPTFCKTRNNCTLRFWKQRYVSKLRHWYLILRHNISVKFIWLNTEVKRKYLHLTLSQLLILAVNFFDLCIGELSSITILFNSLGKKIVHKQINLSEFNVDSSTSKKSLFLWFINPTTIINLLLTAGSNIGFSLVCQAYCTLELFQNSPSPK